MSLRLIPYCLLCTLSLVLLGSACFGQDDPVEQFRKFPPKLLTADAHEVAMDSIRWKLTLNQDLQDTLSDRHQEYEARIEQSEFEIRKLAEKLPAEMRFMDAAARSRLASRLSESLLDARLELAAQETMLKLLEEKSAAGVGERKTSRRSESMVTAAEMNLQHAQEKYQETKKLVEKGYVSQSQLRSDEQNMTLARAELENARFELQAEAQQPSAELAREITELRLQIAPTQARMRAAEAILESLIESADVIYQIELRQRQQDRWQEIAGHIATQTEELKLKSDELKSMLNRIENSSPHQGDQ